MQPLEVFTLGGRATSIVLVLVETNETNEMLNKYNPGFKFCISNFNANTVGCFFALEEMLRPPRYIN